MIENYHDIFKLPYTILRYGSLYGPRTDERNFVHNVIRQALTHNRISRYGDGEEIREYIHVRDAAKGSVEVLSKDFVNQHVILTGNQQMKVKDLLYMIKEMLGNNVKVEFLPAKENDHYEITPYSFAPKTARRLLSKTYLDFNQGILEALYDAHKQINPLPTPYGIITKDKKKR